jgi:hypothetical protein
MGQNPYASQRMRDALAGVQASPQPQMGSVLTPGDKMRAVGSYLYNRFVDPLVGAVTAPGDAYSGKLQVTDPETGLPSDEAIRRSTDLAGAVTLGSGAFPSEGTVNMGIKAYHGTPHDFDQFSMDRIGTGEGAQAYGHGLYFAGNEDVAKGYRDNLTPAYRAANKVDERVANNKEYADQLKQQLAGMDPASPEAKKLASRIAFFDEANAKLNAAPDGRMYQVDINADPSHFLDYDKPLSEQHPVVQDAVNRVGRSTEPYGLDAVKGDMRPVEMQRLLQTPEGTQALAQHGVPGVKYLDQGSRGAGSGSSNYVVFDDGLVSILKKYGWVPGAAMPAAAMPELMKRAQPPAQPRPTGPEA